ncbi:MAG: hypothetical protein ACHQFZ_05715 [Acidimicrobiales bacterium]
MTSNAPSEPTKRPDLVDRLLGAFDHLLDLVHDNVLRPLIIAGRAIAFGFVAVVAVIVLLVALIIGLTRLMNVYLFAGHEWLTFAVLGAIFLVAGMVIWRWRRPAPLRK